jgi:hypothetical protein
VRAIAQLYLDRADCEDSFEPMGARQSFLNHIVMAKITKQKNTQSAVRYRGGMPDLGLFEIHFPKINANFVSR